MPDVAAVTTYPWQPASTMTGNLAIGNLYHNLLERLRDARGMHAETLLAATGALAGFAAQNAALREAAQHFARHRGLPGGSLVTLGTRSGETFLAGEWINRYLYNEPGSQLPVQALLAGAAVHNGVDPADLPDCREMARHVVSSMGTPGFGRLGAPAGHEPARPPQELLRLLWAFAVGILRLPLPQAIPAGTEPPLEERHWPIVIAVVASKSLALTAKALSPRIAYALAMESAIVAAKVDPEGIAPGTWRVAAEAGQVTVARLRP